MKSLDNLFIAEDYRTIAIVLLQYIGIAVPLLITGIIALYQSTVRKREEALSLLLKSIEKHWPSASLNHEQIKMLNLTKCPQSFLIITRDELERKIGVVAFYLCENKQNVEIRITNLCTSSCDTERDECNALLLSAEREIKEFHHFVSSYKMFCDVGRTILLVGCLSVLPFSGYFICLSLLLSASRHYNGGTVSGLLVAIMLFLCVILFLTPIVAYGFIFMNEYYQKKRNLIH